jgi:hypothetical protein
MLRPCQARNRFVAQKSVVVVFVACITGVMGGGCENDVVDDEDGGGVVVDGAVAAARAPLIGAGSGDSADRSCQVVLRDFGRVDGGTGPLTLRDRYVFEGRVDVARAAVAEGAALRLLVGVDDTWHELAPVASTAVDARFDRVLFHVDDDVLPGVLPGPGRDGVLRVIPFVSLGPARVFDHNTLVDSDAAFVVDADHAYAVAAPPETCAGPEGPTLTFAADWTETQSGPVVAGRGVVIDYDIARNSPCRQTYNGLPTWSVVAVATFLPMNVVQQVSVVDLTTQPASSTLARLFAPEGATGLVVYFRNSDRAGCTAYDSDFGRNYHFALVPAPTVRGPAWVGDDVATISRAASARCEGAVSFGSRIMFGSWARQRATITDLCFSAWEPGVTDVDNPELWRQLDVQVHHRFDPSQPFSTDYVGVVDRVGHNARYALDLRRFDPFQWGRCAGAVPVTRVAAPGGDVEQATLELYFTVNDVELRPAGGGVYRVVYEDAASSPRTQCDTP